MNNEQLYYKQTIAMLRENSSLNADDIFDKIGDVTDEEEDAIFSAMEHFEEYGTK